ncbi:MAG: hypothetical protein KIS63_00290 [Caldilineales bacterium]|nr:hypothetical protein [Planctomycetales bacterium]MCW5856695.1 hypothetical protein [Caldilineales bacterium]
MPIRIKDLLEQISSDTEKVVAQTRSRFNNAVRQMLRQETGLRLARSKDTEDDEKETHAIRVFVEAGVPVELQNLQLEDDKWLAILIAPWRTQLEKLQASSLDVRSNLLGSLPKELVCEGQFAGIGLKLNDAASFADHLLKIAAQFDLVKELHAIDDDILGQYRWSHKNDQTSASTHLYWGVIGLVARSLGVSVEGLTVKVLAHELAHAYTHLGADIDGHRWDNSDFKNTERAVKEGLAQYYTQQLLVRLRNRMPEAEQAYSELLKHQPDDYRVQEKWIKEGATPEHIRLAMVRFRRGRKKTLDEFQILLNQAKESLGKKSKQSSMFEDEE